MSPNSTAAETQGLEVGPAIEAADKLLHEYGLIVPPLDVDALTASVGCSIFTLTRANLAQCSPEEQAVLGKISAAYHPADRTIFIMDGLAPHARATALLHELAHDQIPWQAEILRVHPLDWRGLGRPLRAQMEAEARAFSIHMRLLGPLFRQELNTRPYSLSTARELVGRYNLSPEMGLRAYLEHSRRKAVLLTFQEDTDLLTGEVGLRFRSFQRSDPTFWEFPVRPNNMWPSDHLFHLVLLSQDCQAQVISVPLTIVGRLWRHEFWSVGRRHYVLSQRL